MSISKPSTTRTLLLDLSYTGPGNTQQTLFFTNYTDQIQVGGQDYLSLDPTMVFELPEYSGDMEDRTAKIRISDNYGVFRDMISGRAHPILTGRLRQVSWDIEDMTDNTALVLWSGEIVSGTLNPEGAEGLVELEMQVCGGPTEIEIGIIATETCDWRFGDLKTCGQDLNLLEETGSITAINRTLLTVSGLTTPRAHYWQQGSVLLDGTRVRIRKWDRTDPNSFYLAEFPPQTVVDAVLPISAVFRPGCDHSLADCKFYGNESRFMGLALAMPERHPNFELGDEI